MFWQSDSTGDSDDEVFLWVKAELMRSDGDVPELKGRAEIYSIMCPTGVCLWLSVNPGDLQPDLDLLSLHTTSGSAPEGINSSGFKKKKKKKSLSGRPWGNVGRLETNIETDPPLFGFFCSALNP